MKPAGYQIEASQFLYERDNSMLLARMGTGKTLVYLLTAEDWRKGGASKRIMVVAPRRVVHNVWMQERDKWGIDLTIAKATGDMDRNDVIANIKSRSDLLCVNYEMYVKFLNEDHGCDAVIFDELSLLRNPSGKRQKAARHSGFPLATGGTGTPAPNGLTSLFGMSRAVGLDLFGRNHDKFLREYFYPLDRDQRRWQAFGDTPDRLAAIIKPYTFVLEDDAVELPQIVRPPVDIQLPPRLREMYERMRAESTLSDHDIVAGSEGVLRNKLRQMAMGFIYDNAGEPVSLDPWRLEIVRELVENLNGQPVMIMYEFREQLAMMRRIWPDLRWLGGESTDDDKTIALWNAGKLDKLALHPASAGHGLNIQSGGNSAVWWSPIDDRELYEQALARLARRGQASDRVFSYEPCAENTIDVAVRAASQGKDRTQRGLWAALKKA